jgi:hypothetical protein
VKKKGSVGNWKVLIMKSGVKRIRRGGLRVREVQKTGDRGRGC